MVAIIEESISIFLFEDLDEPTQISVRQADKEFDENLEDSGISFLRACKALKAIKTLLKYKRPGFTEYCQSKNGLSVSTANRMISAAEASERMSALGEMPFTKTALYLLAETANAEQVIDLIAESEGEESKTLTKQMVKEFTEKAKEIEAEIEKLIVEDYVTVKGKTGKILVKTENSVKIIFPDGSEETLPLSSEYLSPILAEWIKGEPTTEEGSPLIYEGWTILVHSEKTATITNFLDWYFTDCSNLEFCNEDWLYSQAYKKIDSLEVSNPRPHLEWEGGKEKLGVYAEEYSEFQFYLIKKEGSNAIHGVQIREEDKVFASAFLDSKTHPQIQYDPDWWIDQAKAFLAQNLTEELDLAETDSDWKDAAENGNRSGHLKAVSKKGQTKPHPEVENWAVGDPVRITSSNALGTIDALFPDEVRVKLNVNGLMEKVSYSEIEKPFSTVETLKTKAFHLTVNIPTKELNKGDSEKITQLLAQIKTLLESDIQSELDSGSKSSLITFVEEHF